MSGLRKLDRKRFGHYAAPEAVAVYLEDTRRHLRQVQAQEVWLAELLAKRTAEKEAGTWPYQHDLPR